MPQYTSKVYEAIYAGRTNNGFTPTGAASDIAALTDGSDASYGRKSSATLPGDYAGVRGGNLWAAGERAVSIVPYIRSKTPGAGVMTVSLGSWNANTYAIAEGAVLSPPAASGVIASYQLAPQAGQLLDPMTGQEWNQPGQGGRLASLTFRDPSAASNAGYVYEAGVYIYTTKPAAIAAPTIIGLNGGTITTTQYPTFSAVVSALVESWQLYSGGEFYTTGRLEFSVYRQADAGNGASPPAGVTPVLLQVVPFDLNTYIDGVTLSTLTVSVKAPAPIPDDSYVVYVRVVRDHPSGSDTLNGVSQWSSYQRLAWSQLVGGPYAPGCGMRADDAPQGMLLKITPSGPAGYTQTSSVAYVERLVGGIWRAVRGMSGVPVPVNVETALGYDCECARGASNTYRFRHTMVLTADGTLASSPWTQISLAGPNLIGTGWNLKAVNLPAASWLSAGILTEPAESDQTQATIFYPLDRPHPVVVKGTAGGWAGSYDFIASGTAAVAALRALVDYEGLVLIETAFGDVFYCSLTGVSVKRQGTSSSPRLAGTLTFAQVDCDLATES